MRHDRRGFTLMELLIALAIVGALLGVAFGGLRVALGAWRRGEGRAEVNDELRGLAVVLSRALGAAYPYHGSADDSPGNAILFRGYEDRLEFVTERPPFPLPIPAAFGAVVLGIEPAPGPALVVRERVLPNYNAFRLAREVFRDADVQALRFAYLDATGNWQNEWDGDARRALPLAIRLDLTLQQVGRTETLRFTVSLPTILVS